MREMITEDKQTKIRTIVQLSLNNSGEISETTIVEMMTEDISTSDNNEEEMESVIYDNFNPNIYSEAVGGRVAYDKIISTTKTGKIIYSFNNVVITTFNESFNCNNTGIIAGKFYVDHNVELTGILGIKFTPIDDYSENAKLKLFIDDELSFEDTIANLSSADYSTEDLPFYFDDEYLGRRTKWEIFISGNTNAHAFGKLIMTFRSVPTAGVEPSVIYGGNT